MATTAPPTSPAELEHVVQRRLFFAFAAFVLLICAVYAFVQAFEGQFTGLAGLSAAVGAAALAVGSMAVALKRDAYAWPLRILSTYIVGWLTCLALRQGSTLPSAGWWLSVIPFILGGAGLDYLAIAVVADFLVLVTWLFFGPQAPPFGLTVDPVDEKWRRFVAVAGSELLALGLILVSMRSRAQVARALEHARQMAQSAADLKARFLANMSHEIRTPLTGIIGVAEMLGSPGISATQRAQLIGLQEHSARTLLSLVNDVLDFAKLEAGKVVIEQQPVSLRDIVIEVNELFSIQAFGKGIELSSSCNPDVPHSFVGDAARIRQIVSNLVSNAVKFTSRGGVHIHLAIDPPNDREAREKSGKRGARIEVVDSGVGISEAQLRTLFNPFVQADAGVTRQFGGTGLGLSISSELARLMGGRIEVRSAVGQGSSFGLALPLRVDLDREPPLHPQRRVDVLVCTANRGLERHLKCLLHELRVEPVYLAGLPSADDLRDCRILFVDSPLLPTGKSTEWIAAEASNGRLVVILTPLGADAVIGLPHGALLVYKPVRKSALENILMSPGAVDGAGSVRVATAARSRAALHVLVAEDNAVNQIVVQAMLAELGATSAVANNGEEALAYLSSERFDLVLMDVNMPVLDGLAATRSLRLREASTSDRRVPVIAMSATAEGEARNHCLAAGMDGYLTKPFSLASLRRTLERADIHPV